MASTREPNFPSRLLLDTTPLPSSIPPVREIGSSSAPLLSLAYFIGARCRSYNDDYMQCKQESYGKGEVECMREGRKVTRCAASVIEDVNKHCAEEFKKHFECLDARNQQLWQCRPEETGLGLCVLKNLGLKKEIPGAPKNKAPVFTRESIFTHS